jgi:ParB family chromosome partitioning protein
MSKKSGLGRGLSALIPGKAEEEPEQKGLKMVPVTAVVPNPHQPRSLMDEEKLAELAASIEAHGLIQPLIVTQTGETYTLIAGERRWRASQRAGLTEVPVIIKEATPQAMLELAIIENVQRADLNAVEEATAYRQLMDEFGLKHEEVAQRVGKARSTVSNLVRLLELPKTVQQAVINGEISSGHARTLASLPTADMQTAVMQQIIKRRFNVREAEALVQKLLSAARPTPRAQNTLSPELVAIQTRFEQTLGTRVSINKDSKGGKVVIHFYSDEELQTIYEAIVKE